MQLNREELLRAYRSMVTIRRFEERVQEEFSKGGIPGFVHLYAGEEASAVGVCQHLGPKDYIASTHRGHGHSIAKGCDVVGMMQELFGKEGGLCGGKGGSMHIADLDHGMLGANGIVGGGPPLVVGAALTAKTLGTGKVAVCFSGDGASNQGTTFEALNMAVVLKLPAVFVFENNQYGEGTGFSYRGRQPRHRRPSRRLRAAGGQGQRRRFLRSARGGVRGGRARPQRRRPERHRGRYLPLLRPPFGRRAALPRQGRGQAAARGARLPGAFPPPGRPRPPCSKRTRSTRSTARSRR